MYPGRLPPVGVQWARLSGTARAATVAVPLLVIGLAFAAGARVGAVIAVMVVGAAAASAVYVKNRTDRHNAAVDRGEITVVADPGFAPATAADLPAGRLHSVGGFDTGDVGRVVRFDGGWIVGHRNPRDVAVVLGDDGGWARFDPRVVTDLWAVAEYRAGRGRDG